MTRRKKILISCCEPTRFCSGHSTRRSAQRKTVVAPKGGSHRQVVSLDPKLLQGKVHLNRTASPSLLRLPASSRPRSVCKSLGAVRWVHHFDLGGRKVCIAAARAPPYPGSAGLVSNRRPGRQAATPGVPCRAAVVLMALALSGREAARCPEPGCSCDTVGPGEVAGCRGQELRHSFCRNHPANRLNLYMWQQIVGC